MSFTNIIENKNIDTLVLGVLIGGCLNIGTAVFLVLVYVLVFEKKIIKTQDNSISLNQIILKLCDYFINKEKIN